MHQLLQAISYIHEKWYIHRDLKTSNLLYKNGRVCLGDFGSARKYGDPLRAYTQMVITQYYRPPELLIIGQELPNRSENCIYSTAVDIWGVGCIFGELLLRKPLFPGESELGQLIKILEILGTPNEKDFNNMTKSPYYQYIKVGNYKSQLKQRIIQYGGYVLLIYFIRMENYLLILKVMIY